MLTEEVIYKMEPKVIRIKQVKYELQLKKYVIK